MEDQQKQPGTLLELRPCKKCGMQIELRIGPSGRAIPFQRVRSVYLLTDTLLGQELRTSDEPRHAKSTLINHFETCPYATDFSRKNHATEKSR